MKRRTEEKRELLGAALSSRHISTQALAVCVSFECVSTAGLKARKRGG